MQSLWEILTSCSAFYLSQMQALQFYKECSEQFLASDTLCQQDGKESTSDIRLVGYVQDIRFYSVDLFCLLKQFAYQV